MNSRNSLKPTTLIPGSIVFLLLLAFTIVVDVIQLPAFYKQFRTSQFAQIQGIILESRVDNPHGKSPSYRPILRYSYTVNDHSYTNDTWRFATGFTLSQSEANAIVRDHPLNKPVTVFYDPANPATALLSPGLHGQNFLMLALLLPLNLILALLFFVVGYQLSRRSFAPGSKAGETTKQQPSTRF